MPHLYKHVDNINAPESPVSDSSTPDLPHTDESLAFTTICQNLTWVQLLLVDENMDALALSETIGITKYCAEKILAHKEEILAADRISTHKALAFSG